METSKSKPRQRLAPERIVECAIDFADRQGLEGLSMRKLATLLGVTPMALYNHVRDKDALIGLMGDLVMREVEAPVESAEWGDQMRIRAVSFRDMLERHPWAASVLTSRVILGENILNNVNATTGCLVASGFSYQQADWARNLIDSYVYGFTMQALNFPVQPEEYTAAVDHHLPMISATRYPHIHAAGEEIRTGIYDGCVKFEFGLDLLLEGISRWHQAME